jgi:putative SOS response-associated peptidase YedK
MFAAAFAKRRCLVPATLFYEWNGERRPKQPYVIGRKDDTPFAFGGIWESWGHPENLLRTFAILTTAPNEICAPIHDRMPVIVAREDWTAWLVT